MGQPAPTSLLAAIQSAHEEPRQLEELFRGARRNHSTAQFASAIAACHAEAPSDPIYAAWHYRLSLPEEETATRAQWAVAVPLSLGLALAYWLLTTPSWQFAYHTPLEALLWAPVTGVALLAYLGLAGRRHPGRMLLAGALVVALTLAVVVVVQTIATREQTARVFFSQSFVLVLALHLPLVVWAALALGLLGPRFTPRGAFAFLTKSIESAGTAGIFAVAALLFAVVTNGLFAAISVRLDDAVVRLLIFGTFGLIPVMAIATAYDATLPPEAQEFRRGLGRVVSVVMRALLAPALLVLLIYIAVIPFNFMQPFTNRDVLIIYNVLLFGIVALLVGATPLSREDVPARWEGLLRAGIVAIAALVVLVGIYALAAVLYRTEAGSLTLNRLVIIGWNVINIGLLSLLLLRQARAGRTRWIEALHSTFAHGAWLYVFWALCVSLVLPWFFH